MDVLSWTSMLSRDATILTNFLIIGMPKVAEKKSGVGATWDVIWRVLLWSLDALFKGVWPSTDWRGKPFPADSLWASLSGQQLAGGYGAYLWTLRADLEFMALHFHVNHPSSNHPCPMCGCDRSQVCV